MSGSLIYVIGVDGWITVIRTAPCEFKAKVHLWQSIDNLDNTYVRHLTDHLISPLFLSRASTTT